MTEHLIAYLTWDRLVAWKILSLKISEGRDELMPIAYGSKQKIFRKYARAGNMIWVFSMPSVKLKGQKQTTKYRPTLVAKIRIKDHLCSSCSENIAQQSDEIKKLLRYWGYVAIADPDQSKFFELNDATEILLSLEFQNSSGKIKLFDPPVRIPPKQMIQENQFLRLKISQKLQTVRRLSNGNEGYLQSLVDFAGKISNRKVFISYAHDDGRDIPLELADSFLNKKWSPWIDSLAIPPKSKREKNFIPPLRLKKLLEFGIKGSAIFAAWKSEKYYKGEGQDDLRWTMKEWNFANKYKKTNSITIVPFTTGAKNTAKDIINLEKKDTDSLASNIIERWQKDQLQNQ